MDFLLTLLLLPFALPMVLGFVSMCCCGGTGDCTACDPQTITTSLQVTVSGVVDGGGCTGCSAADGVWILANNASCGCSGTSHGCRWCVWDSSAGNIVCGACVGGLGFCGTGYHALQEFTGSSYRLSVTGSLSCCGSSGTCVNTNNSNSLWRFSQGTIPNCNTWSSLSLTLSANVGCDASGATCTVDSI